MGKEVFRGDSDAHAGPKKEQYEVRAHSRALALVCEACRSADSAPPECVCVCTCAVQAGVRAGSMGMLAFSLVTVGTSFVLPPLIRRIGQGGGGERVMYVIGNALLGVSCLLTLITVSKTCKWPLPRSPLAASRACLIASHRSRAQSL
jgi:hypothetical protein